MFLLVFQFFSFSTREVILTVRSTDNNLSFSAFRFKNMRYA